MLMDGIVIKKKGRDMGVIYITRKRMLAKGDLTES